MLRFLPTTAVLLLSAHLSLLLPFLLPADFAPSLALAGHPPPTPSVLSLPSILPPCHSSSRNQTLSPIPAAIAELRSQISPGGCGQSRAQRGQVGQVGTEGTGGDRARRRHKGQGEEGLPAVTPGMFHMAAPGTTSCCRLRGMHRGHPLVHEHSS